MASDALVAHTPAPGSSRWHPLDAHLLGTAERAAAFAAPFGASKLARWAGVWHDVGKAHPDWQAYLQEAHRRSKSGLSPPRNRPRHKLAGTVLAMDRGLSVVAAAIHGHHGGLPDRQELKLLAAARSTLPDVTRVLPLLGPSFPFLAVDPPTQQDVPAWARADRRTHEGFGRMLFSCLVDADYLDTEAHFAPERRAPARRLEPEGRLKELQAYRATLSPRSPLADVREQVFSACARAGAGPRGLYRLAAPTGAGKTLASLGFALSHASTHGLDRVIVALPYLTIIDQTVDVYQRIFGDEEAAAPLVLEHHSAVDVPEYEEETEAPQDRLAAENWDAPIIVTTMVQLFESLFGNRPSACRKLHNLARSVIVLDEVQTLPVPLLAPTVVVLRELVDHYGASVLLSTATQPALDDGALPAAGLSPQAFHDVLPDARALFAATRRVAYEVPLEPWAWPQVADEMRGAPAAMAIVNTRSHALALLDALGEADTLHLSTYLCAAHRREVLEEVRERLAGGRRCRLVATQVVEAGVDVDFPVVLRALGPLDRIVQAAGRCNREGWPKEGRVIVFQPEEDRIPRGVYATATELTRTMLAGPGADLHDPGFHEAYFRELLRNANTDQHEILRLREDFNYPEVAQRYRFIADDTTPVIVPYGDAQTRWEATRQLPPRLRFRRMQPYTVAVHRRELEALEGEGLVSGDSSGLRWWTGAYDARVGIGRRSRDPATLIVG